MVRVPPTDADSVSQVTDFLKISGTQFVLGGEPLLLSGANTYYLGYKSPHMVDAALDSAVALGCNVVRTWAFLDAGTPPDGEKEGVCFQYRDPDGAVKVRDGDKGLNRLDYVVKAAKDRNLRLILPLVNNWIDFGGMDRYVEWFGLRFHDEFYTSRLARDRYKDWARTLLSRVNTLTGIRYRDEPAIAAWELANEPRWRGSNDGKPSSGPVRAGVIRDWAIEMSGFLREQDPNHLIGVGDEGFFARRPPAGQLYDGSHGTDFDAFLALPHIDFGTYHMYPEEWRNADWGEEWIDDHLQAGAAAGKPVLLEEYGLKDAELRNSRYARWLDRINAAGGGALVWMLAAEQDDGTPYPDYDRFTIYGELDAPPVRAFARPVPRPTRNAGTVLLSLLTSDGTPMYEEGVELRFKPHGSSIDRIAAIDFAGEPVALNLPIVGSPPSQYLVQVTPRRYRFGALGIISVPQEGVTVLAKPLAREPEQWRVQFEAWTELSPRFAALKATLGNSPDLRYFRGGDPGALRTAGGWDQFGYGDGSLPKACLLNLYHRLSTLREPVGGERTWWSMIDTLLEAGRERLIAVTPLDTARVIREISESTVEYSKEYRRAEDPAGHRANFPAPFQQAISAVYSVKTIEAEGNLQLTAAFLRDQPFALIDVDIDENGIALRHFFDVLRHNFTNGTHPFDIHELLHQAAYRAHTKIDLGYRLERNA